MARFSFHLPSLDRRRILFWVLLTIPFTAVFLPAFQTHYEEDILLLVLCAYLLFRACNDKRRPIPQEMQSLFFFLCAGLVYSVLWFGLIRGYLNTWGRFLALFPALLVSAVWLRPPSRLPDSPAYQLMLYTLTALSPLVLLVLITWRVLIQKTSATPVDFSASGMVPYLLVFPILACVLLISRHAGILDRGRDHLPLSIAAAVVTFAVWSGNASTWTLWYKAGELERAWTPFKYDKIEEIAAAERKPYEAARVYHLVHQRIMKKGELPRYLNWPFFMKYRMAFQAMRKQDPHACLAFLPPAGVMQPDKIAILKQLWHVDFVSTMRETTPDYNNKQRIFVDYEMNPERTAAYALDRWGRVYSYHQGIPWLEWDPEEAITDALDLELHGDAFVVLRSNGNLISSKPIPMFAAGKSAVPPGHRVVDLEIFRRSEAAILVTEYGGIYLYGHPPERFPDGRNLQFGQPAAADMELDPDEKGYYLLDIYGAIHSNHPAGPPSIPHNSPPVPKSLLPYWTGLDMAIDLELDPLGRCLYVYNRLGEVFSVAVKPFRETYRSPQGNPSRGVSLAAYADGRLYAFESNGAIISIP